MARAGGDANLQVRLMGCQKGEPTSPFGHGGFGGSLKAPLNGALHRLERCMAGATGGSAAGRSRGWLWHGSNPIDRPRCGPVAARGAGVPKHDARTRRHCAVRRIVCLIVLAIMPRRRDSDRRSTGRDATGGKTGGGHAAAFPTLAKLGLRRQKPAVFVVGGTACLLT